MGTSTLKKKSVSKPTYTPLSTDVVEHMTNGKIAIVTQANNVTQMVKVTIIHNPAISATSIPSSYSEIVQDWDFNVCKKFVDGEVIIKN